LKKLFAIQIITLILLTFFSIFFVSNLVSQQAVTTKYDFKTKYFIPYSMERTVNPTESNLQVQTDETVDEYWVREIMKGGYVIHLRHTHRNESDNFVTVYDQVEVLNETYGSNTFLDTYTCLSDQGKSEAQLIKVVFEMLKVQFNEVISSPVCRARQTAEIIFGKEPKLSSSLVHRSMLPERQYSNFNDNLKLLILNYADESNLLLVGHNSTFEYGPNIFEKHEFQNLNERKEGGIYVIEAIEGKLYLRHIFYNFRQFTKSILAIPE